MFEVLIVSAANRFGCVAIFSLYFSAYLLISSMTVGIPRSLCMSLFLTYHGAFTIGILSRIIYRLCMKYTQRKLTKIIHTIVFNPIIVIL